MTFNNKELKTILKSLYKGRGEISGGSQSSQLKINEFNKIINRIEDEIGPYQAEKTEFDKQMEKSLNVLKTGTVSKKSKK